MLRIENYPSSVDNFHGLKWYLIIKEFFLARVRLFVTYRLERASEPNGTHACRSKLLEKLKSETSETVVLLRNEAVYIAVPR